MWLSFLYHQRKSVAGSFAGSLLLLCHVQIQSSYRPEVAFVYPPCVSGGLQPEREKNHITVAPIVSRSLVLAGDNLFTVGDILLSVAVLIAQERFCNASYQGSDVFGRWRV
jgi:hypothetical protein